MTVKEFIKELQKYDLNKEIVIEKCNNITEQCWHVRPEIKEHGQIVIY